MATRRSLCRQANRRAFAAASQYAGFLILKGSLALSRSCCEITDADANP